MGYHVPIALPYKYDYDDNVLTVTDDLFDENGNWLFLKPESNRILFEYEQRLRDIANNQYKERMQAEKAIANSQEVEEFLLSGRYTIKELNDFISSDRLTLEQLKKKYKTVRNFRDKFFCLESPSKWEDALRLYNGYIKGYNSLILECICKLTPDQLEDQPDTNTDTNTDTNPNVVSVAFLKNKYKTFKEAKEALNIKARSWQSLAEKLYEKS